MNKAKLTIELDGDVKGILQLLQQLLQQLSRTVPPSAVEDTVEDTVEGAVEEEPPRVVEAPSLSEEFLPKQEEEDGLPPASVSDFRILNASAPLDGAHAGEAVEAPTVTESLGVDPSKIPLNQDAWRGFTQTISEWSRGFGVEGAEQPDRMKLMEHIAGSTRIAFILRWIIHYGSLQRAVLQALVESKSAAGTWDDPATLDQAEAIAGNMAQISHFCAPDISKYHDITGRWRRSIK
jgi:hypothetical protein